MKSPSERVADLELAVQALAANQMILGKLLEEEMKTLQQRLREIESIVRAW